MISDAKDIELEPCSSTYLTFNLGNIRTNTVNKEGKYVYFYGLESSDVSSWSSKLEVQGNNDWELLPILRDSKESSSSTTKTFAGVVGNVLEWYDFACFGYFSDILADQFFPKQAGDLALLEAFAVFGAAFLMRPIGGLVLGIIGINGFL